MRVPLLFAVLLAATLALPAAAATDAVSTPRVTAAVQVTTNPDPSRAHTSPQIAVHPTTGELVVVQAEVRHDERCRVHRSTDDGRTWVPGGDPMVEPFTDCSLQAEYGPYASLAFGRDGTLYLAFVASEHLDRARDDTPRHVFLARSEDAGRTFQTTMVFQSPDGDKDMGFLKGPMVAVDPNNSANVYVGWRHGVFRDASVKLRSTVVASTDGGRTFGDLVDLTDERGGDYPGLAVDGEGTLHAVYWARTFPPVPFGDPAAPVRPIVYRASTDQGATFSDPVEIDPGNQSTERPPLLAADPDSGALYMVWAAQPDAENLAEGYDADTEIFLRVSRDGGATWTDRIVVNDDDAGAEQLLPGIAIAPDGRVDIAWYDDRLSPGGSEGGLQDVFATWSTDGGRSFAPNLRITDRSIDRTIGVFANNVSSNHNVGIASTRQAAYLAWQDSRNADPVAQPEDIYMAKLVLSGPTTPVTAVAPGSGTPWSAVVLGAAGALLVAGLALLVLGLRGARVAPVTRAQRARL